MILDILSALFIIGGTIFILISAIGVVRMPDLYLRMSSSTKSSTLGVGLMMIGAAIHFIHDLGVAGRAIAIVFFLLLTAPVAAHLMGRAAYYTGVPLWDKTRYDQLKGQYKPQTNTLESYTDGSTPPAGAKLDDQQQSFSP